MLGRKLKALVLGLLLVVLGPPVSLVHADYSDYRSCSDSEDCVIGEFVYDDEYQPVTTATCTLTSKNPDGTDYLSSVSMPGQSDGWYGYTVATSGKPDGLYRSQMCCTVSGELMCLDKSFIIADQASTLTQTDVTEAVWDTARSGHATAGTFGENLQNPSSISAADIWNYPSRSLSNFGTLIADIWAYAARTLTGAGLTSGSLATSSEVTNVTTTVNDVSDEIDALSEDIEDLSNDVSAVASTTSTFSAQLSKISAQTTNTNILLERAINQPIIKTFMEVEEDVPDLISKLQKTKQIALQLSTETKQLKQNLITLNSTWKTESQVQSLASISTVSQVLGATTEKTEDQKTLAAQVEWLRTSWDAPVVSQIKERVDSTLTNSSSTARELRSYGKTPASTQYLNLATVDLNRLEKLIGTEQDTEASETLFGYIESIEQRVQLLTTYSDEIDTLLADMDSRKGADLNSSIAKLKSNVLAVNQIPSLAELANVKRTPSARPLAYEENTLLSLKAINDANLTLLAQSVGKPIRNIWLENGSIVFKALATNPSKTIVQTIPIKYYLPEEIKEEHILEFDDSLTLAYDQGENAIVAAGDITLQPNETKVLVIKTVDVWQVDDEELTALRKQSDILFQPLKGTSYFAQGATLKADIDASLDKVQLLMKDKHTPEARIRAYREAQVELNSAKTKLENLKTLASSAGSVGTIFGFVGGVQTIAVWGLIIILVAGFVFLALYLKVIAQAQPAKRPAARPTTHPAPHHEETKQAPAEKSKPEKAHWATSYKFMLAAIIVLLLTVIGLLTALLVKPQEKLLSPTPNVISKKSPSAPVVPFSEVAVAPEAETALAVVVEEAKEATESSQALGASDASGEDKVSGERVIISLPSYSKIVNVRVEPNLNAKSIFILWSNKEATKIDETEDWVKVELTNSEDPSKPIVGWVYSEFVTDKAPSGAE
jgi:hypothetical protein